MREDDLSLLEFFRFELSFLEDGGYGRSPRTPWRPTHVFEDSITCLNFGDPARPHPCSECSLIQFVPDAHKVENSPCRFIPLTEKGETIDYFDERGDRLHLEEALAGWLREQINRIEKGLGRKEPLAASRNDELSKLAET